MTDARVRPADLDTMVKATPFMTKHSGHTLGATELPWFRLKTAENMTVTMTTTSSGPSIDYVMFRMSW